MANKTSTIQHFWCYSQSICIICDKTRNVQLRNFSKGEFRIKNKKNVHQYCACIRHGEYYKVLIVFPPTLNCVWPCLQHLRAHLRTADSRFLDLRFLKQQHLKRFWIKKYILYKYRHIVARKFIKSLSMLFKEFFIKILGFGRPKLLKSKYKRCFWSCK